MGRGGSQPGERRGGRRKGTPNKNTAALAALAREHTEEALNVLVKLMRTSKNEVARQRAADSLLDRGWGRPSYAYNLDASKNLVFSECF
jgi:hypothetical protein